MVPEQVKGWEIETLASARPVETDRADKAVSVLLAHIVAARCRGERVTDADMDYPKDWRTLGGKSTEVGHQESGRTVAIHSLAVAPKLHGCGIGKMIVKAYIQQMNNSGMVDRIALICQDVSYLSFFPLPDRERRSDAHALQYLVEYYKRFGFAHLGESPAQFGGGGWHDMVRTSKIRSPKMYLQRN